MKNDFINKGIKDLKNITLSQEEKGEVFARLMEHIEQHPARVVSPWKIYVSRFRFQYAIASLLIMVLAGGSVTFAAEGALPGDLLYPVKLNVNEPLQGALISGDMPKAHWEAARTVRRLEEAETLAAQGRLTGAAVKTVKENFEKSVNEFNATIRSARENATSMELVNATVDFEATINAHVQILSVVGNVATSSLANDMQSLRSAVDQSAQQARGQRDTVADAFFSASQDDDVTAATATEEVRSQGQDRGPDQNVERALLQTSREDSVRRMFNERVQAIQTKINDTEDQLRDTATSTASSSVQRDILENSMQSLRRAERALREAEEEQGSGDKAEAFSALLDSESAVKQADTALQQGLKLGKEERDRHRSGSDTRSSRDGDSSGKGSGRDDSDNSGRRSGDGDDGDD